MGLERARRGRAPAPGNERLLGVPSRERSFAGAGERLGATDVTSALIVGCGDHQIPCSIRPVLPARLDEVQGHPIGIPDQGFQTKFAAFGVRDRHAHSDASDPCRLVASGSERAGHYRRQSLSVLTGDRVVDAGDGDDERMIGGYCADRHQGLGYDRKTCQRAVRVEQV
jgi:hypothetical protein